MGPDTLPTCFAPSEQANDAEVLAQHQQVIKLPLVRLLLESFPEGAVLLNEQRQIVYANDKLTALLGASSDALLGLRLGVALDCVHAHERPAGCGTTESCRHCGAARAMEDSRLSRTRAEAECRILRSQQSGCSALDLRVNTTPLELDGARYILLAVRDISDQKRRELLERIFFHDLLNLAGGLRGLLDWLPGSLNAQSTEYEQLAAAQTSQLIEIIQSQRDLVAAERGELIVHPRAVAMRQLLERLRGLYCQHPVAQGRTLVLHVDDQLPVDATLHTDPVLLGRALANLITNAMEASAEGDLVTVRLTGDVTQVRWSVHNPAVMPAAVRAQLFQRSFTTKPGPGRGLGSYSVKLLVERYLHGRVEFASQAGAGTTFHITLPTHWPPVAAAPATPAAAGDSVCDAQLQGLVGCRVLVADDDVVNRKVVERMLHRSGLCVQAVVNGREAVTAVQREAFDLVLMDLQMPEMDGLEAAAAIRRWEREAGRVRLPILALTSHAGESERQSCLAAGMDDLHPKPATRMALLQALWSHLRQCRTAA